MQGWRQSEGQPGLRESREPPWRRWLSGRGQGTGTAGWGPRRWPDVLRGEHGPRSSPRFPGAPERKGFFPLLHERVSGWGELRLFWSGTLVPPASPAATHQLGGGVGSRGTLSSKGVSKGPGTQHGHPSPAPVWFLCDPPSWPLSSVHHPAHCLSGVPPTSSCFGKWRGHPPPAQASPLLRFCSLCPLLPVHWVFHPHSAPSRSLLVGCQT